MARDKKQPSAQSTISNNNGVTSFWRKHWREALILFVTAIGLYAYSIQFEYVLDDKIVISENSFVKKGYKGIKEILTTESFAGYFGEQMNLVVGARYRPLSIVTFALEYQYFGLNTRVSHLLNILLYGLSGLLLFRLISMLVKQKTTRHWFLCIPFVTALLFVIHPIHSEVVANVKGRDEILTLLFSLLAFYSFFKAKGNQKVLWSTIGVLTFSLALLSKENALTFIAVIPLGLYFFTKKHVKDVLFPTLLLLVTGLVYLYLRYTVIGYFLSSGKEITDIMNNPFANLKTGEKFATIFYTLGLYIKLLFFPHPLTHDYYPYHIPVMSWSNWQALFSFLLNAGLFIWAIIRFKKKDLLSFGILFYFITLSIVSNLPFTVGTFMNERFLYIPSLGFCLIIAWLINEVIPKWLGEKKGSLGILNSGLFALIILGYVGKTIDRIPAWENTFSLNTAAIKVSKNSARANLFMGTALYNLQLEEKDPTRKSEIVNEAEYYINRAIEINSNYGSALNMKAGIAAEKYKLDKNLDKLLQSFYELLTIRPSYQFVNEYIEYLLPRADNEKLAAFCLKVGQYWSQQGQFTYALMYLENYGLRAKPDDPQIRQIVSYLYQQLGNDAKAAEYR